MLTSKVARVLIHSRLACCGQVSEGMRERQRKTLGCEAPATGSRHTSFSGHEVHDSLITRLIEQTSWRGLIISQVAIN